MDPIVLKPGGGEAIDVAGNDVMFKAEGEHTGGHIGLTEYTAATGQLSKTLAEELFSVDLVARLSAKYDIQFA